MCTDPMDPQCWFPSQETNWSEASRQFLAKRNFSIQHPIKSWKKYSSLLVAPSLSWSLLPLHVGKKLPWSILVAPGCSWSLMVDPGRCTCWAPPLLVQIPPSGCWQFFFFFIIYDCLKWCNFSDFYFFFYFCTAVSCFLVWRRQAHGQCVLLYAFFSAIVSLFFK